MNRRFCNIQLGLFVAVIVGLASTAVWQYRNNPTLHSLAQSILPKLLPSVLWLAEQIFPKYEYHYFHAKNLQQIASEKRRFYRRPSMEYKVAECLVSIGSYGCITIGENVLGKSVIDDLVAYKLASNAYRHAGVEQLLRSGTRLDGTQEHSDLFDELINAHGNTFYVWTLTMAPHVGLAESMGLNDVEDYATHDVFRKHKRVLLYFPQLTHSAHETEQHWMSFWNDMRRLVLSLRHDLEIRFLVDVSGASTPFALSKGMSLRSTTIHFELFTSIPAVIRSSESSRLVAEEESRPTGRLFWTIHLGQTREDWKSLCHQVEHFDIQQMKSFAQSVFWKWNKRSTVYTLESIDMRSNYLSLVNSFVAARMMYRRKDMLATQSRMMYEVLWRFEVHCQEFEEEKESDSHSGL